MYLDFIYSLIHSFSVLLFVLGFGEGSGPGSMQGKSLNPFIIISTAI